jgi:hypothetical protein
VLVEASVIVGVTLYERMYIRAMELETTVLIGATTLKATVLEDTVLIGATVLGGRPGECG